MDIGQNLDKTLVEDINGIILIAGVPMAYAQEKGVVLLVKLLLGPPLLGDTGLNEVLFLMLQAD